MVVVSCRNGKVVGYVSGTSLAAKAHMAIIQTMSHFPSSTRLLSLWPGLPVAASVFGARPFEACDPIYYAGYGSGYRTTQTLSRAGSAMDAARTWRAIFTGFAGPPVTRSR